MPEEVCGVIGATSLVGSALLPRLIDSKYTVAAFSRHKPESALSTLPVGAVIWNPKGIKISHWILLAPIWVLNEMLPMMEENGARKIVVLSTTSLYTKGDSDDKSEQELVKKIAEAETTLSAWADARGIDWIVLRPTLIYGFGVDKNISEIARIIKNYGLFPLLGKAQGLRQPVHADDVAWACQNVLIRSEIKNCAYNISGSEVLTYREMIGRVFSAMHRKKRLISIPRWAFQLALLVLNRFKRFQTWSVSMVDRMNQDMVFDHDEAAKDFGFKPRPFQLEERDLPS